MTATRERAVVTHGQADTDGSINATIHRIRSEYREMPGLRLTFEQMRRLWVLDRQTCRTLVEKLVDARFLKVTPDGQYVRCDFRRQTEQRRHHQEV